MLDSEATRPRGRPRDPEKREAILAAATALFMERGFASTSMEAIARRAGVSKPTLYGYFPDKDALFRAAVMAKCEGFVGPEVFEIRPGQEVRAGLALIAMRFLRLVTDPDAVAIVALINREANRAPQLPHLFFEVAVAALQRKLGDYLQRQAAMGRIRVADPGEVAWRFLGAVKGEAHMRAMLGLPPLSETVIERHIEACVSDFLTAHGVVRETQ